MGPPTRIGIVKLSSLGDVVHALPVLAALRRGVPGARLTWIVEAREAAVLRGHPDLERVVEVDTRGWRQRAWRPAGALEVGRSLRDLAGALRDLGLDVAIDLQGLMKSGLIAALTRAPLRIGFQARQCRERLSALCTTRRVALPAGAVHAVERCLALLAPLGVAPGSPEFRLPARPDADRRAESFLSEQGIKPEEALVALNPGAARAAKRWPAACWSRLADGLASECGARVLLLWGPGEAGMAHAIHGGLTAPAVLAPPTDLDDLGAFLRRASLVIASDTGPLHLAAALGRPALGLYGPTRAAQNGPYGPRCRSLESADGAMTGLPVDRVLGAAQAMLAAAGAHP